MTTNMQYLGIYEDAINDAIDSCERAMSQLDFDISEIDDMNYAAVDDLQSIGDWHDITNSIISAYFSATRWKIKDRYPDLDVDYYVNCDDSHFYIDNVEV